MDVSKECEVHVLAFLAMCVYVYMCVCMHMSEYFQKVLQMSLALMNIRMFYIQRFVYLNLIQARCVHT